MNSIMLSVVNVLEMVAIYAMMVGNVQWMILVHVINAIWNGH